MVSNLLSPELRTLLVCLAILNEIELGIRQSRDFGFGVILDDPKHVPLARVVLGFGSGPSHRIIAEEFGSNRKVVRRLFERIFELLRCSIRKRSACQHQ